MWLHLTLCLTYQSIFYVQRRYDFVRDHLMRFGSSGLDVMLKTCTVQVNLDYSSETDMIRKFRASLALQPVRILMLFSVDSF